MSLPYSGAMRVSLLAAVALVVMLPSCENCPSDGSGGSLFCHAESCAADENSCGGVCANLTTDSDNCGACGHSCGDGLVCSQSQCVEPCPGAGTSCDGSCVDTSSDANNCGSCDNACGGVAACSAGSCSCPTGDVVCGGTCIDPTQNTVYCGASGNCSGTLSGKMCKENETCLSGTCTPMEYYFGSLPMSTGSFTYNAMAGLDGADLLCSAHWPNTEHCSYQYLLAASMKTPSELINATDFNGIPVTDWWIDDPTATNDYRCSDQTVTDTPWTYQTAHLGNVGKYVTLSRATGTITAVMTGTPNRPNPTSTPVCNTARFVACCAIP